MELVELAASAASVALREDRLGQVAQTAMVEVAAMLGLVAQEPMALMAPTGHYCLPTEDLVRLEVTAAPAA